MLFDKGNESFLPLLAAKTIDFGRAGVNNCPAFEEKNQVVLPDFKPHHIYGKPGQTVFTAEIGPSASEQGYKALTGKYLILRGLKL